MKLKAVIMVLNSTIVIRGCDISYWQGTIDFNIMYAVGIRFVIIRAGYGTKIDKNFVTYINSAIAAGIIVGIYWFMYANGIADAKKNAQKCIEVITPYKEHIVCGVWCDWEYDSDKNAGYISNAKRSSMVRTFLSLLQAEGYEVGIYSNQDYIKSGKFTQSLIKEFPLWFAKYSDNMGIFAERGLGGHPYVWQNTSKGDGQAYGVQSRYLDLNRGYFTIEQDVNTDNVLDNVQSDNTVIKASDNPYPKPTRIIYYDPHKYLMRGDDIKHVQWDLWRFGLFLDENGIPDAKKIDGLWGTESDEAFVEAQRRLGLNPDRKCGPVSLAKFQST